MILELVLQLFLGFDGLREYQHPGRLTIQTVHDENPFRRPLPVCRLPQECVHGSSPFRFRRHGQQSRRLINNDDGVIFK